MVLERGAGEADGLARAAPGHLVGGLADRERRAAWRLLGLVAVASVVVSLNTSLLNVALPVVVRQFQASSVAGLWIILSYTLPSTVLLTVFGRIGDSAGRSGMYMVGVAVFGASNLLLGIAPNIGLLIALRIAEALGSAMIMVNSVALIIDATPSSMLPRSIGLYNASFSVAQVLGPTAGAVLVQYGGWRWIFWVNVVPAALCLIAAHRILPARRGERGSARIPIVGALLLASSLSLAIYAISDATNVGWSSPIIWGGLLVAGILGGAYAATEMRTAHPLVDWRLIRGASLARPLGAALAFTLAQFSLALLIGLYFEGLRAAPTVSAGLRLLPLPISTAIAAGAVGLLTTRLTARAVAAMGLWLSATGLLAAAFTLSTDSNYVHIAILLVLIGSGGMFLPANTTVIFSTLARDKIGMVNSVRLLIQNSGLVLSTALTLTIISTSVPPGLRHEVLNGTISEVSHGGALELMSGYRVVLFMLFGFAVAGALLTILPVRGKRAGRRRGAWPDAGGRQRASPELR